MASLGDHKTFVDAPAVDDDGYSMTSHERPTSANAFPAAGAAAFMFRPISPDLDRRSASDDDAMRDGDAYSEGSHEHPARRAAASPDFSVGSHEQADDDELARIASGDHEDDGDDSPSRWSTATARSRTPESPVARPAAPAAAAVAAAPAAHSPSPPSSPSTLSAASFPSTLERLIDDHVPDGTDPHVQLGETVPYAESTARKRGVKRDAKTGDHIPSAAALKKYGAAHGDPRSAGQINSHGLTTVVTDADHRQFSRTYGGRNTAAQIDTDSKDLGRAIYRDVRHYGHEMSAAGALDHTMLGGLASVYRANAGPQNPLPAAERPVINRQTNEVLQHYLRKLNGTGGTGGTGGAAGGAGAAT